MAGEKRPHSGDGESPPPSKAVRSECFSRPQGNKDESGSPPSSQLSGDFPSTQPGCLSSHITPPASSQLPITPQQYMHAQPTLSVPSPETDDEFNILNVAFQTVSDVAVEDKTRWRKYTDPEAFFKSTGWPIEYLGFFLCTAEEPKRSEWMSMTTWLERQAIKELSLLRKDMQNAFNSQYIKWERIFGDDDDSDAKLDDLIYVWIQVKLVDFYLYKPDFENVIKVLRRLIPKERPKEKPKEYQIAENAFHAEEKPMADGRQPSDDFCNQLLRSFVAYNRRQHLAPYISVLGPSGIGKSFIIQQMAVRYGMYVKYTNLAPPKAFAYPCRSVIAKAIPNTPSKSDLVEFWEVFIAVSLIEVERCRKVGVTATGLYNLHVKDNYIDYQETLSKSIVEITKKRRCSRKRRGLKDEVLDLLEHHTGGLDKQMRSFLDVLSANGDNQLPTTPEVVAEKHIPDTLFCFDEARQLTDEDGSRKLKSLLEALKTLFDPRKTFTNTSLPGAEFFAVFVDMDSKITTKISPPAEVYHGLKVIDTMSGDKELLLPLPPIYAIHTMDVFRDPNYAKQPQDGSYMAAFNLFQFGRPLWGSRCKAVSGDNISNVVDDHNYIFGKIKE